MVKDGTTTKKESNELLPKGNKKIVSKKSRKNYYVAGLRYTLGENGLTVLEKLAEGQSQTEIAKTISLTKKGVNYWVKKFLELDFIKFNYGTKPKYYRITPLGLAIITRSEKTSFCMMEDYPMKFRLIEDYERLDWKKLGKPRNWEKVGIKVGGVTVEKTSKHIIIHTGQINGSHPDECLMFAGEIRGHVKAFLDANGIVMDPIPERVRKPIFKFYTKEAEILHSAFGNVSTNDGVLDASDGVPHEEYSRKAAINYLAKGNRLERIEETLNQVLVFQEQLANSVFRISKTFANLGNSKPPLDSSSIESDKSGMVI